MNETGERCLWLAFVAALPLGGAIGVALGLPVVASLVLGLSVMALLAVSACGRWSWSYVLWLHRQTKHWVLTVVAIGMPDHYFPVWLEQMQAQLDEVIGDERRKFVLDLLLSAPRNWVEVSWARLQYLRTARYRGSELRLAQHLAMVLAPDGPRSSSFDLLHAVGISRLQNRRAAHGVPALVLMQQLLSTKEESFKAARTFADALLETRERIHLLSREAQRTQLRVWPRQSQLPYSLRYDELEKLRADALERSEQLRAALRVGIEKELGLAATG